MSNDNKPGFVHLHVHSHYSILDGMSKVPDLVEKCKRTGMNAIALTDHGNMFGIKELTDYVNSSNGKAKKDLGEAEKSLKDATDPAKKAELEAKVNELRDKVANQVPFKAIVGIEAYCARRTLYDKDKTYKMIRAETGKEMIVDRSGYHLILLAKNKTGYKNLCKLSSIAYTDGYYDRPRIDKVVLEKYHEGLIVCSACLGGEIPQLIIAGKMDEAEKSVRWFKDLFGDDYYIELQRHQTDKPNAETETFVRQQEVIPHLVELARKVGVKLIASNDVHFVEEEHSEAHDRLICLSTGRDVTDPNRMHYTKQEWLKTPEEMAAIFPDYPEALANTLEIADKVETYSIESGPIMPMFDIPEDFGTTESYRQKFTEEDLFNEFTRDEHGNVVLSQEDAESKIKKLGGYDKLYRVKLEADYLSKLAWEGAHMRYGENLTPEQTERIIFELHVMKTMGFPGYFLIVSDYIRAAREELGVSVGPGRGSAAGSVVAYCLKITDVDPLKYDLLFERFLNPDRISLPDIDVDFDDLGRGKVLDWVTEKYGKEKVAHIITYGTMATKSSIADVGRVQKVPLTDVNYYKSIVPESFADVIDPETGKTFGEAKGKKPPKVKLKNCLKYIPEFINAAHGPDQNISTMLQYASQLEDTVRQVGIHACGVIIGADDLTNFAPLCTVKDRTTDQDVLVTQYDGHVIESVGLIKMDFLGLSTLSIIKEAIRNIKRTTGEVVDIDAIPIDDPLTYKLFSEGRTTGIFQFESPGMKKYLRELKPTVLEDLIAMNALYRPGPIEYIPKFIKRKQGEEPITYDIPVMEKYLKDTYGVTVYQEQVMLLSRLLGGFTRGQSDALRKAMGKKIIKILNELKPKFIAGGVANGHDEKVLNKIWADWEAFASYAFNKSHATCYAWVAYQTAYLKAHYPAEYMAANLTQSKDTITDVAKHMEECKQMGIAVKSPNVNESELNFAVNHQGQIVFGLGGVKGVGEAAVEAIISEREKNGPYKDIFDFVERVNLSACNKKTIETLAYAGAFDTLSGITREQFFATTENIPNAPTGSDILVRYGNTFQNDKHEQENSLFGAAMAVTIQRPQLPKVVVPWSIMEKLNHERDVVSMYLSQHPLDLYALEMRYIVNTPLTTLAKENLPNIVGKSFVVGGIVSDVRQGISQKGNPYMIVKLEDTSGPCEFGIFGENFSRYSATFAKNAYVSLSGVVSKRENKRDGSVNYNTDIRGVSYLSELLPRSGMKAVNIMIDQSYLTADLLIDLDSMLVPNSKKTEIIAKRAADAAKAGNMVDNIEQGSTATNRFMDVRFTVYDGDMPTRAINFVSKDYSIELAHELITFADEHEGVKLSLVK